MNPKEIISCFLDINSKIDIDNRIIDVCVSYLRHCLKANIPINFYDPEPTLDDLIIDTNLNPFRIEYLREFSNKNNSRGVDKRIINLLVAYAGIIIQKGGIPIFDISHLAYLLDTNRNKLLLYSSEKYKSSYGYHIYDIPKKSGGVRQIEAPSLKLKEIQKWILEHILRTIDLHLSAHGFRENHSIATNASFHVGKDIVINIDLVDFFPNISSKKVLNLFLDIGYAYNVAVVLTRICTLNQRLPQGAPTSPALSNLICSNLDKRLFGLARHFKYSYTRYADDITFSSSQSKKHPFQLINTARIIIENEGFKISSKKLTIRRKSSSQMVTGLVVNRKVNIPRKYSRNLRATIHGLQNMKLSSEERLAKINIIRGKIAFIKGIAPEAGEKYLSKLKIFERGDNE